MAEFHFPFAPQPDCPLLELPSAIRQEIIRLTIVEHEEEITPVREINYDPTSGTSSGRIEMEHDIMKTCKQLRRESAKTLMINCPSCGKKRMAVPLRGGVCTRGCENDGPGDGAAPPALLLGALA